MAYPEQVTSAIRSREHEISIQDPESPLNGCLVRVEVPVEVMGDEREYMLGAKTARTRAQLIGRSPAGEEEVWATARLHDYRYDPKKRRGEVWLEAVMEEACLVGLGERERILTGRNAAAFTLLQALLRTASGYVHQPEKTTVKAHVTPRYDTRLNYDTRIHVADALSQLGFRKPRSEKGLPQEFVMKGKLLAQERREEGRQERNLSLEALTQFVTLGGDNEAFQRWLETRKEAWQGSWAGDPQALATFTDTVRGVFTGQDLSSLREQLGLDREIFGVLQRIVRGDLEIATDDFVRRPTGMNELKALVTRAKALDEERTALLPTLRVDTLMDMAESLQGAVLASPTDGGARDRALAGFIADASQTLPVWARDGIGGLLKNLQAAITQETLSPGVLRRVAQEAGLPPAYAGLFELMVKRTEVADVSGLSEAFTEAYDITRGVIGEMIFSRRLLPSKRRIQLDPRIPQRVREALQALMEEYQTRLPSRPKARHRRGFPLPESLEGTLETGGTVRAGTTRISPDEDLIDHARVSRREDQLTVTSEHRFVPPPSGREERILHITSTTISDPRAETTVIVSNPTTDERGMAEQLPRFPSPSVRVHDTIETSNAHGALDQQMDLSDGSRLHVWTLYDAGGNYLRSIVNVRDPRGVSKDFQVDLVRRNAGESLNMAMLTSRDAAWSSGVSFDRVEPIEGEGHQLYLRLKIKFKGELLGHIFIPAGVDLQAFLRETARLLGEPPEPLTPVTLGIQPP